MKWFEDMDSFNKVMVIFIVCYTVVEIVNALCK